MGNIIYHFACLEDEDVGAVKKAEFPWPLNDEFFEVAQNPVDWKYQVYVKCCNEYKNFKRYKNKDKKTIELVRKLPHPMIIYVARPDDAERVKKLLCDNGIRNTRTYTGLTTNDIREQLLKDWKANKFEIMIATSAFGVGVDKSDVRTVLHLYIPQNPNVK